MKIKKVINIEDNVFKHIAIKRALERCGVETVIQKTNGEDGVSEIERAIAAGQSYDLLVVDMHFSVHGEDRLDAGEWVIEKLKEKEIPIPIILCSSIRYQFPGTVACIFYNEKSRDIDSDMRDALRIAESL